VLDARLESLVQRLIHPNSWNISSTEPRIHDSISLLKNLQRPSAELIERTERVRLAVMADALGECKQRGE